MTGDVCCVCGKGEYVKFGLGQGVVSHLVCVEKLFAELAALRARRCEACAHWKPLPFQDASGPRLGGCGDGVEGAVEVELPADFACNRWSSREDGES